MPVLTPRKKRLAGRSLRPSKSADNVGVSVSALKSEMPIEQTIVSANCLYSWPVSPRKERDGHEDGGHDQRDRDGRYRGVVGKVLGLIAQRRRGAKG